MPILPFPRVVWCKECWRAYLEFKGALIIDGGPIGCEKHGGKLGMTNIQEKMEKTSDSEDNLHKK